MATGPDRFQTWLTTFKTFPCPVCLLFLLLAKLFCLLNKIKGYWANHGQHTISRQSTQHTIISGTHDYVSHVGNSPRLGHIPGCFVWGDLFWLCFPIIAVICTPGTARDIIMHFCPLIYSWVLKANDSMPPPTVSRGRFPSISSVGFQWLEVYGYLG